MNIEVEENNDQFAKVRLSDSNEAVANALRRAMMTQVPTLAVKHIDVVKNESGLFDEMLASRIGQVPFTIPQNVGEEDKVHIALKQEGPGQVVAEDLKTDNDEAEPVNPKAVIVDLKEDQAVDLEGEAVLGQGEKHAKHQGGTVGYEKVEDGEFLFRVESTSGYTNEELLEQAVEEVKSRLDEFEEAVSEL